MSDDILQAIDAIVSAINSVDSTLSDGFGALDNRLDDVKDTIHECVCQGSGGSCCCGAGDGPVVTPGDVENTPCTPPEGFESWSAFLLYACRAANWYADKIIMATTQTRNIYIRFMDDYLTATTQSRLSISQVFQRVNGALPEILDTLFRFNLTNLQQADLTTKLADRVYEFTSDVILRVPETDDYGDVIYDWFSGPLDEAITWMQANEDDLIDDIYNLAESGGDVLGLLQTFVSDAIAAITPGVGLELTEMEDILLAILSLGVSNLKYIEAPAIAVYEGTTSCSGLGGCTCDDMRHIIAGTTPDQTAWTSELADGYHQVDFIVNATGPSLPGDICGDQLEVAISNLVGHTTPGDDEGFIHYGDDGLEDFNSSTPWAGATCNRRFRIRSTTPFTVDMGGDECS